MSDIFISYANTDRTRVKLLVDALQARGWSVWWDRKIPIGKTYDQVIEAALIKARCVVVLWSRDSILSDWVRTEADEAKQRGILVPARLDDVSAPLAFRRMQAANLVGWDGALPYAEFEELAGAVAELLSQGSGAPVAVPPSMPVPGSVRKNPKDGLNYVWIPPGSFTMGCSPGDSECYDDEKPSHQVTITKGFWMGQTPVTQEVYQRVTGQNPSHFTGPNLPVENLTWDEAQAYCQAVGARLPTEAEWEYAARGGNASSRYGALDDIAWYKGNSGDKTHDVGQKQPNAYGLYDMLGNVWEWTADWFGAYSSSPVGDPIGPAKGEKRALRGGSWDFNPWLVRVSGRPGVLPGDRSDSLGLRCVLE